MLEIYRSSFIAFAAALVTFILLGGHGNEVHSHDEPGLRPHHIDVPANPTAVMRAFTEGKFGGGL